MTKRDDIHATDVAGAPLAGVPLTVVRPWPAEGSMTVGVLCGITLSLPLWVGVFGAARALVGALRTVLN